MAVQPPSRDPWYRSQWGRYNRPYGGCGCLYTLLILLLVWMLCGLLFPGVGGDFFYGG